MKASLATLVVLVVVSLTRADTIYDGDYNYDDIGYDYDNGYVYPDETHDYPDESSMRGGQKSQHDPHERRTYGRDSYDKQTGPYEDPTFVEVNGQEETYPEGFDDDRICAQSCNIGSDEDVIYQAGKVYNYQYHGEVVTRSRATNSEESRMTVRAYVIITARTPCDLKMKIVNLAMNDSPAQDSKWFKEAVEKYDLHFSYKSGMISYLCPNDDEDVAATNFKRGILSTIQSKMTNMKKSEVVVYEADVLGECETEYRISQPNELVVNKTKHNCRHNNHLPYIPHEHYSRRDLSGELPFYSSHQTCVMHLYDRVWNRVECVEEMEMKEFRDFFTKTGMVSPSPFPSLASISISSTLSLEAGPEDSTDTFARDGVRKRRESLRMDLEGAIRSADTYKYQDSNVFEEIHIAMEYLMAISGRDSGMSENRPQAFAHLVTLISQLERDVEIDEIWGSFVLQKQSRQFLLDALLLCESRSCMRRLATLAGETTEAFPESSVLAWLTGVHFQTQTYPESVEYLMDLGRKNMAFETQAVMAASSVVHRLCQQNQFNCRTYAQPLLDYVTEKVGDTCGYDSSHDERLQVKLALRALSNAGVLPEEYFPRKCYLNKLLTPKIRMAALQTYRRVDCKDLDLDSPWQVLEDSGDDVGVRITAYLSMVNCAPHRPKFFTRVKNLLHKEEVNQVASYIWTHVRNLAEQPDGNTYSRELAHLANHHTLQAKFITNAFRTSRSYRVAQFSKLMNIGGSIDSDIIFTPESFIPRHNSHKFHLDFLENSIDAFEIGSDLKGFEEYFDRLFGKEGYFANEDILKVLETLRPKRDIHEEKIEEFQRIYDESRTAMESDPRARTPEAAIYLRVFGNEIFFVDDIFKSNPWMLIKQFLQEISMPKSFQILKQEFVSPTLLGFPLRFRMNATGSVTFDHTGNFNMNSLANFNLEGTVAASTAISMDEMLVVEGYGSSSGVRRRSTHVVDTEFGGKIDVKGGKLVDVQFNIPKKELAHVSSSVNVALYENSNQGWNEKDHEGPATASEFCTQDAVSTVTGLEFCSVYNQAVIFTDTGDKMLGDIYDAEYSLTKIDSFDFYKFNFMNKNNRFELSFDTPGSSINRKLEFQVNVRDSKATGTLTIPSKTFEMEGTYENNEALKKIALLYKVDSVVLGEIDLSLPIAKKRSGVKYTPKFLLNLNGIFDADVNGVFNMDPSAFTLEANMKCSLLRNPLKFEVAWENANNQHKIDTTAMVGNKFGSSSGTLLINGEKTLLQLETKYGTKGGEPTTLAIKFDKSLFVEDKDVRHSGYLMIESSAGNSNVELEFEYGSEHAQMDTNITVNGEELRSHVAAKNIVRDGKRDLELSLSFVSPQYGLDYLGRLIYKVLDNAFQGEIELSNGPTMGTKLATSYSYDKNPLHLQGGVHFHINDNVILQLALEMDMSQPGIFLLTSSDVVGPAVGVVQAEVHFNGDHPFKAKFDVHAGYEDKHVGLKASTTSDEEWGHFEGSLEATWFDWKRTVYHKVDWQDVEKRLTLEHEEGGLLDIMLKTEPDAMFQFLFQRYPNGNPDIKFVIGKRVDSRNTIYETYLQTGTDDLFHLTATDLGDNTYTGKAKFLSSQVELQTQLLRNEDTDVEAQVQATITLPSGDTFRPQVTLKHTYDGQVRDLMFSSKYNGEVIEGHVMMMKKDGWFLDDTRKVSISFKSPIEGLRNISMAFETHRDWSEPWSAKVEWQSLKVWGEMKLKDIGDLDLKMQYEDGGTCDSIFHLYNKYENHQYVGGITLGITKAHDPWAFEVIVSEGENTDEQSLTASLTFQSPMSRRPFEANASYKYSDTHFSFECEAGTDSKTTFTLSGENETVLEMRKLVGALNFNSPWAEPIFFNVENLHDSGSFNVSIDLRTSIEPINSVRSEFSVNYEVPEEIVSHFDINNQNIQMSIEMIHKLTGQSLMHQIQGSFNSIILNYELNAKWDEHFRPGNSDGRFTLTGFLDRNLEISFSHTRDGNRFNTQLTGSWDWYEANINHLLEFDHSRKWSSTFQLKLPNDKVVTTRLFLNGQRDSSSAFESTFHFDSSWTEGFTSNLEIHREGRNVQYDIEATYGDTTLFNIIIHAEESLQWDKSNFSLEVFSIFENIKFAWQHDFNSQKLVELDFTYGQQFHVIGKSYLSYNHGLFSQEFKSYDFQFDLTMVEPNLHIKTNFGLDDIFSGEFQLNWYDYLLILKSSIPEKTVFAASLNYPGNNLHTELTYEAGEGSIPDFNFKITRNDIDLFTFKGEFTAIYPKFEALFVVYYFDVNHGVHKNERFQIKADLSNIEDYAFKGMAKITSEFGDHESYWADVDTKMSFTDNLKSYFHGQLHVGDWDYKTEVDVLIDLYRPFHVEYNSAYELTHGGNVYDKKELHLKYSHSKDDIVEGLITSSPKHDSPLWSAFFNFNKPEQQLKAYVIPGNEKKYELNMNLSGPALRINAQRVDEQGVVFNIARGNISWNIKKVKKQWTINFTSDIPAIKRVTGHFIIQQRKGLAANVKLGVNGNEFTALLRFVGRNPKNSGKVIIKIENEILVPFNTDSTIQYEINADEVSTDLKMEVNGQKDWIKANLKGSLPETYIRFNLPLDNFKDFDLTLVLETEDKFGFNASINSSVFCFDVKGSLSRFYDVASLSSKFEWECSGNPLYDFNFSFDFGNRGSFLVDTHLLVQNFGNLFNFKINGKDGLRKTDITIETEIYPLYYHTTTINYASVSKEFSLQLHTRDTGTEETLFLFRFLTSSNKNELEIDFENTKVIYLNEEHEFSPGIAKVDASFSHSIFGFSFNGKLTLDAEFNENAGKCEVHLFTDGSFDHADLTLNYENAESFQGNFSLETSNGNAEGKATIEKSDIMSLLKAEMQSSLHTFKNYQFEVLYEFPGNNRKLHIKTMQDEYEFEINCSKTYRENTIEFDISANFPFEYFSKIDMSLGYPTETATDLVYEVKIGLISSNNHFEIHGKHTHQESWQNMGTQFSISTPLRILGNYEASFMYDLNGQTSFNFASHKGKFGFDGSWRITKKSVIVDLNTDVLFFNQGRYHMKVVIPRQIYQKAELEFSRLQTDLDFDIHFLVEDAYKNGELTLKINPSGDQKTYLVKYNYKSNLVINGQWDNWNVTVRAKFNGRDILATSGTVNITANFGYFETINGSWDFQYRRNVYSSKINIDIDQNEPIQFESSLSTKSEGSARPWENVILKFDFSSPYTRQHKLDANYSISDMNVAVVYQYGSETFKVNLNSTVTGKKGSVMLSGNIPLNGLSTFNLNFEYNCQNSHNLGVKFHVEEIQFDMNFTAEPNWMMGRSEIIWSSPFTSPLDIGLKWSFDTSPLILEASWKYRKLEGGLNMHLEYSDNTFQLQLHQTGPFNVASKVDFTAIYDSSVPDGITLSAELKIDEHITTIKFEIMNPEGNFVFNVTGLMEMYGIHSSVYFRIENANNGYKLHFLGQTGNSEELLIKGEIIEEELQFGLKYGKQDIMVLQINYTESEIRFGFDDLFLNIKSQYKLTGENYNIDFSLDSSETSPLTLKATVLLQDSYEGSVMLKYGEKEYNINGTLSLKKKATSLEFHFESSEDPHNPIIINAMYNLTDFLQGRMRSQSDLALASFEWGDKINFALKGQRRGKNMKLDLEISTPFDMIPKLHFGFDGDLTNKGSNIDFNFNSYFEWSDKVTIMGNLKLKNKNKLDSKISLTTPFSTLKDFSLTLKHTNNHIEASVVINEEEWKTVLDYETSPMYSLSLMAQTPINGYREILWNISAGGRNNKFSANSKFSLEKANIVKIKVTAEMWNLSISLNTPWEPLKNVSLTTSLKTESEELMYNLALKWSLTNVDFTFTFSPAQLKLVGIYNMAETTIGTVEFEYHLSGEAIDLSLQIETPFKELDSLEASVHLSFENCKLSLSMPFLHNFHVTLDAKNYWQDMILEGSINNPNGGNPYTFKIIYSVEPDNYTMSGVAKVMSDITWISVDVDFISDWRAHLNFYESMIKMDLIRSDKDEINFSFKVKPVDFDLASLDILTTFKYGDNYEVEGSSSLEYKFKGQEMIKHELKWQGNMKNSVLFMNFNFTSNLLEIPYELQIHFPLVNILKNNGKILVSLSKDDEELYSFSCDLEYPQQSTFEHLVRIKTPDWTSKLSMGTTRSNFHVSFSFPDEETQHSLVLSWPSNISLEKITLQMELSSPHLNDGDVNMIFNFSVQKPLHFALSSSFSYGTKIVEVDSTFKYNKRDHKVLFEGTVTSEWIGSQSVSFNAAWARNFTATLKLVTMDQEHNANLQMDEEEFTAEFILNSPWISTEEVKITGMMNKDIESHNIMIEARLETNEEDYSIEGKFESTNENYIEAYFIMKHKNSNIIRLSGLFQLNDNLIDFNLKAQSDMVDITTFLRFRLEEEEETRSLTIRLSSSYSKYVNIYMEVFNSKDWREEQRLTLNLFDSGSIRYCITLGEEKSELEFSFYNNVSKFVFDFEYEISHEIEFEIHLQTPFNAIEFFDFEWEWTNTRSSKKHIKLYYQWYDDNISFNFNIMPDSVTGYTVGVYLTTPFEGYEKFGLQTPQMDSDRDYNILIEYPSGKVGLELHNYCPRMGRCDINYSLYLPFEGYEIITLKYGTSPNTDKQLGIQIGIGKVGFALRFSIDKEVAYNQFNIFIRVNEYKTESYLRVYDLRKRVRFIIHTDFEMHDLLESKFFDLEYRYDPAERMLLVTKTDQGDWLRLHAGWGTDKVIAITTPKMYPGYLVLNLESSKYLENYQIRIGLCKLQCREWENYGFHIYQKLLGYGRDIHFSGEARENQFAIEGTITLNPMYNDNLYIKEAFSVELNHRKTGFVTDFHIDYGFFKNSYKGDLMIILPEQILHWDTYATCSDGNLALLSNFKWNDDDEDEEPIILNIDVHDISELDEKYSLQAIFSHPQIHNLTLQGNLTHTEESSFAMAEFIDENDPQANILFMMTCSPGSETDTSIINVNITHPSSNFVLGFNADITESVFRKAAYKVNYWNHSDQRWEIIDITTGIEPIDKGWTFNANMNKSNSNWGYRYNGSLIHQDDLFSLNVMGASKQFMDYWSFETSVNKYLPELNMQLEVGQSKLEPHEVGRIQAGLHNPLELGIIIDHERFGVWRQDVRAGLRLLHGDILQFIAEYDPSFDFTSESLIYRLNSPASKVSQAWQRDLSYTAATFQKWMSSEIPEVMVVLFSGNTFQAIESYGTNKFESFKDTLISTLGTYYESFNEAYTDTIQPFIESSYRQAQHMYRDAKPFISNAAVYVSSKWAEMVEFFDIEYVRLHDSLIEDMDRLSLWWTETNYEMNIIFNNIMYEMVRSLNTLYQTMDQGLLLLKDTFGPTFEACRAAFERYGQELEAVFGGQCWPRLERQFNQIIVSLNEVWDTALQFIQPEEYWNHVQELMEWIVNWHHFNVERFNDGLYQLRETIKASPFAENLKYEFRHVRDFVDNVRRNGLYSVLEEEMTRINRNNRATADMFLRELKRINNDLQSYAKGNILFDYIDAITGASFNRMIRSWEELSANQYQVLDTFQKFFFSSVDSIKRLTEAGKSIVDESFMFSPARKGKMLYNQYLPVPWNSFLESPQWFRLVNIFQKESPMMEAKRKLAEGMDNIHSVFGALALPGSILPPFTATATVYGQQVTTFDLLHYQFLGTCSYLMTKDFVGGDFEVIGDYKRSPDGSINLDSMVIRTHDAEVTLRMDGTVDVTRLGSAQVDTNHMAFKQGGLLVTCNNVSPGCAITVSSKYFGRLAGLFGNYNYEPSDDSKGPDGVKAQDGNDIANNWAVSSNTCYLANQVRSVTELSHVTNYGICNELYLRASSPLSRCFMKIDPRPYFWHCVRDFKRSGLRGEEGLNTLLYDSAEAYRTQCASRGVHMKPLHQYSEGSEKVEEDDGVEREGAGERQLIGEEETRVEVKPLRGGVPAQVPVSRELATCLVNGESVVEGWSETYEGNTQGSADIVFVIELANCNNGKNLQLLMRLLKVTLKRAGIKDVRYGLVTISEESMNLQTDLMSEEEVNEQLGNLVLEGRKAEDGGAEAIKAAARQIKWRPGVSRNIVQLPCRACDDGAAVTEALAEHDITYHIITKFKIIMNGGTPQKSKNMAAKVYGFDRQRMFTPKDIKKFIGNKGLRKLFQEPEDSSCFEAAQTSGGSVFNLNKWITKSIVAEKKFLGIIGHRVLESSSAPECQECRCLRQGSNGAVSCRECGVEWPVVETQEIKVVEQIFEEEEDEVEDKEMQEGDEEYASNQEKDDGSQQVLQEIKDSFKEQFIDENAAIALVEQNQQEHGAEEGEEGEEEYDGSEESEEDGEYGNDEYEYEYK